MDRKRSRKIIARKAWSSDFHGNVAILVLPIWKGCNVD